MQHSDCTPRIPTVTAEEAVKMSWLWSSSQTLKEVSQLFNAITEVPNEFGLTGAYRFMGLIYHRPLERWQGAGHPGRTRPAEAQGTDHRTVTETPSDSPQTAAEGVFHRSMIDSWFLLW